LWEAGPVTFVFIQKVDNERREERRAKESQGKNVAGGKAVSEIKGCRARGGQTTNKETRGDIKGL